MRVLSGILFWCLLLSRLTCHISVVRIDRPNETVPFHYPPGLVDPECPDAAYSLTVTLICFVSSKIFDDTDSSLYHNRTLLLGEKTMCILGLCAHWRQHNKPLTYFQDARVDLGQRGRFVAHTTAHIRVHHRLADAFLCELYLQQFTGRCNPWPVDQTRGLHVQIFY